MRLLKGADDLAEFHRTKNGTPWLEITCEELSGYSGMDNPICDNCLSRLAGVCNIILLPILNEAYCPKCGKERLDKIRPYSGDRFIEERRTRFYLEYFGLQEDDLAP